MPAPRILAFSGSLRTGSFNDKLVAIATAGARNAGADVTHLHLRDYPLPVYDGDLEATGTPDEVMQLKQIFREHDGLLISSPEYNSSISGALKNAIDWISRPEDGQPALSCFSGKVAGLMSAAAGGLGGMRGLPHVRAILQNIQVMVLPTMIGIPAAHDAFDDAGNLKDAKKQQAVEALGVQLTETLAKLGA